MNKTHLTWSWLNVLTKKRYDALLETFGSLESALQHIDIELLQKLGCREDTAINALNRLEELNPDIYVGELTKRGIEFVSIEDTHYPAVLREIGDPPVFLYYKGDLDILKHPCIAFVGKREMSAYGKRVAEAIVPPVAKSGVITVSGLAAGIDAMVATETLGVHGKTVGVLGHGLALIEPQWKVQLAEQIVQNGGLILSEYALDVPATKYTYPGRNRIVAGLSMGTVVLEAGEGSGALITADLALEYGRDIFAVPGQIFDENYAGCHSYIAKGQAKLLTSAEELLQEYRIHSSVQSTVSTFTPQTDEEEKVYGVLTSMPQSVTDIVQQLQGGTGMVNATLTMMELSGGAKNTGGGMWIRL